MIIKYENKSANINRIKVAKLFWTTYINNGIQPWWLGGRACVKFK